MLGFHVSLSQSGWDKYQLLQSMCRKSPLNCQSEMWLTEPASVLGCSLGDENQVGGGG